MSRKEQCFNTPAAPLPLKFKGGGRELSAFFKWHCSISIHLLLREIGHIQVIGFLLLDTLKRPATLWSCGRTDSCSIRP